MFPCFTLAALRLWCDVLDRGFLVWWWQPAIMHTLIEEESSDANRRRVEIHWVRTQPWQGFCQPHALARLVAFQANKYPTEAALPCSATKDVHFLCFYVASPWLWLGTVVCFTVSLDGLVSGDWENDSACGALSPIKGHLLNKSFSRSTQDNSEKLNL